MGLSNSTLTKDLDGVDQNEKFWGLENFGNTCYINSVLQALFYCKIFRDKLIKYVDDLPSDYNDGSILLALADLFKEILAQPKQSGSIYPRRLVRVVQHSNPDFHSPMHQDAQELLSFLLNRLSENIQVIDSHLDEDGSPSVSAASGTPAGSPPVAPTDAGGPSTPKSSPPSGSSCQRGAASNRSVGQSGGGASKGEGRDKTTLIEEVFVGSTVTNTRCMNCEKVSRKKEDFKELKVEMEQPDTTLERCMLASSHKELLQADNKLHCTGCNSYQEAYKWVKIESFPPVLIIHFNRFAFTPMLEQGHKLKQRIAFRNKLTPPREVHSIEGDDIVYELTAVVVHVGTTLAHGHYITYVHTYDKWFCFDDGSVHVATQKEVEGSFGEANVWSFHNDMHAYLLFYQLASLADEPHKSPEAVARRRAGTASEEGPVTLQCS